MLEQIKDLLLTHKGKRNPITSAEIAHKIGIIEDEIGRASCRERV